MTIYNQAATTGALTVGVMLDMDPMIELLDPYDVALTMLLPSSPCHAIKVEWMDDVLNLPFVTTAATATTAEAVLTVATGTQGRLKTGDVLVNQSTGVEYIYVTGYGTTADTLLITRGYASSTAQTIGNGQTFEAIGQAGAEGQDPADPRFVDRVGRSNFTQIIQEAVKVTGTERAVSKYGVADEWDYQIAKKYKEVAIVWNKTLMYGVPLNTTTASAPKRLAAGFKNFISTNVDTTTTTLTEAALLTQIQACFDAGGSPDTLVMGSKNKKLMSGFTTGGTIQVVRDDGQRGTMVETFMSDFGPVRAVLDRWCKTADLFIFARDQAVQRVLRPTFFEMLAKTGDSFKGEIVGERTLQFEMQRHAARFSALT